jgi:hypothetical protein
MPDGDVIMGVSIEIGNYRTLTTSYFSDLASLYDPQFLGGRSLEQ